MYSACYISYFSVKSLIVIFISNWASIVFVSIWIVLLETMLNWPGWFGRFQRQNKFIRQSSYTQTSLAMYCSILHIWTGAQYTGPRGRGKHKKSEGSDRCAHFKYPIRTPPNHMRSIQNQYGTISYYLTLQILEWFCRLVNMEWFIVVLCVCVYLPV